MATSGDFLMAADNRSDLRSTIVTSQLPVALWHEHLGEPTVADAILDRLLHHSTVVNIKGGSYRMRAHMPPGKEGAAMLG